MAADIEHPVVVPLDQLPPETLRAVVESFVMREGTDYGTRNVTIESKVADVMRQLERGEAVVVFDAATETTSIVLSEALGDTER